MPPRPTSPSSSKRACSTRSVCSPRPGQSWAVPSGRVVSMPRIYRPRLRRVKDGSGPRGGGVLNIAHRGARAFAPENTLEAFEKAARLGCPMFECDVHLSADGELIVVHDDDLVRCSNVREAFPGR